MSDQTTHRLDFLKATSTATAAIAIVYLNVGKLGGSLCCNKCPIYPEG